MLSGITHPNPNTQNKVRYLSDYFDAAVKLLGKTPEFHTDNHLFLLEELCFYLSTLDRVFDNADSILTHPLWDHIYPLRSVKSYPPFGQIVTDYKGLPTLQHKQNYIGQRKKDILVIAKSCVVEMRRVYLRHRVDDMIQYVACSHDLDYHMQDLNEVIRAIVSLLVLDGYQERYLLELFDRMMNRDPKEYPFPKKMAQASPKEQEAYLNNLTFREHFRSLRYATQKPKEKEYFIFRCFGIQAPPEFDAVYDQVQFVHADNSKFDNLKVSLVERDKETDFFKTPNCVYAIVITKNNSTDSGARAAISLVRKAVDHLKAQIGDAFHLDPASYLTTSDFVKVGWRLSFADGVIRLNKMDLDQFKSSAYALLRNHNPKAKKDFLRHERVYSKAVVSGEPSDYWIYGEVLSKGLKTNDRIVRLAEVSAIGQPEYILNRILGHLYYITAPMNTSHEALGITREQDHELYKLWDQPDLVLPWLEKNVTVPIVQRLVAYARAAQASTPGDYVKANTRLWIQTLGQRNSTLHMNEFHQETLLNTSMMIPQHVRRIRIALVRKMVQKQSWTLGEVLRSL